MRNTILISLIFLFTNVNGIAQRLESLTSASFQGDYIELITSFNANQSKYKAAGVKSVSFNDLEWKDELKLFFDSTGRLVHQKQQDASGEFKYLNNRVNEIIIRSNDNGEIIYRYSIQYKNGLINKILVRGRNSFNFIVKYRVEKNTHHLAITRKQIGGENSVDSFEEIRTVSRNMTDEISLINNKKVNRKVFVDSLLIQETQIDYYNGKVAGGYSSSFSRLKLKTSFDNDSLVIVTIKRAWGSQMGNQILSYYKLGKLIVQHEIILDYNEPMISGSKWTYEYFPNGLIKEEACKTITKDNSEVIDNKINYTYEYWLSEK